MQIARQLPDHVRMAFRQANARPWFGALGILSISGLILAIGFAMGLIYCEARRVSEFQQLARVTDSGLTVATQCMETLQSVTPAAIIIARNQAPAPRPMPVAVRDSARERRWVTRP